MLKTNSLSPSASYNVSVAAPSSNLLLCFKGNKGVTFFFISTGQN